MKRHPALQDLSRDHHVLLLHARRLEGLDHLVDVPSAQARFVRFAPILLAHLQEESALPLSLHPGRLQADDHARLRLLDAGADPAAVAKALRDHVRLHETVVFESLQAALTEDELRQVAATLRMLRSTLRTASGDDACDA